MLLKRVIPCLDVDAGRVVKGTNFVDIRDAGDPVELAVRYEAEGADELCFLDITASSDQRATVTELARRTADDVFIPFTIGGGIRSVGDAQAVLDAGADKVSVNSAAVARPELIDELAEHFGGEILLTSMDRDGTEHGYELALTRAVADAVDVPVIASGGAGRLEHLVEAIEGGADAVLCASIFHYGTHSIAEAKQAMAEASIPVRRG